MDKTNSKIITLSFAGAGALFGFTLHLLIKIFAGAFGFFARAADSDLIRHGFPVVVGLGLFLYFQFNTRILSWADEVVTEVRKVVWPSQKDTMAMTIVCIIMVLVSSVIISSFDLFSSYFIKTIMR